MGSLEDGFQRLFSMLLYQFSSKSPGLLLTGLSESLNKCGNFRLVSSSNSLWRRSRSLLCRGVSEGSASSTLFFSAIYRTSFCWGFPVFRWIMCWRVRAWLLVFCSARLSNILPWNRSVQGLRGSLRLDTYTSSYDLCNRSFAIRTFERIGHLPLS